MCFFFCLSFFFLDFSLLFLGLFFRFYCFSFTRGAHTRPNRRPPGLRRQRKGMYFYCYAGAASLLQARAVGLDPFLTVLVFALDAVASQHSALACTFVPQRRSSCFKCVKVLRYCVCGYVRGRPDTTTSHSRCRFTPTSVFQGLRFTCCAVTAAEAVRRTVAEAFRSLGRLSDWSFHR